MASPIVNITHQSVALVTIDKPIATHHNQQKSIVYITVHSWCYTFYGFGQIYNDM